MNLKTQPDDSSSTRHYDLILLLPSLAVTARRLHDVDKSGWWMLIALTLIGLIPLFVWYVSVGTKKKNKFGPPLKLKK